MGLMRFGGGTANGFTIGGAGASKGGAGGALRTERAASLTVTSLFCNGDGYNSRYGRYDRYMGLAS